MTPQFNGVLAIPVTPFDEAGQLDEAALARVVEFQFENGASAVVGPVFVSEFYALTGEEHGRFVSAMARSTPRGSHTVMGVSAPTLAQSLQLLDGVMEHDPDAVIAIPPYVRRASVAELEDYYGTLSRAAGCPVFIQNPPTQSGLSMSADVVTSIIAAADGVMWVKEESDSAPQAMSQLLRSGLGGLGGVVGGLGGRRILEEFQCGALGTMPGGEFTDLHVALWSSLETGGVGSARALALYGALLPLITLEAAYGVAFCKEVLRRRGVIPSARTREPATPIIDTATGSLIDLLLTRAMATLGEA